VEEILGAATDYAGDDALMSHRGDYAGEVCDGAMVRDAILLALCDQARRKIYMYQRCLICDVMCDV